MIYSKTSMGNIKAMAKKEMWFFCVWSRWLQMENQHFGEMGFKVASFPRFSNRCANSWRRLLLALEIAVWIAFRATWIISKDRKIKMQQIGFDVDFFVDLFAEPHSKYCWWKKSCTSWYGTYPIICRVLYVFQLVSRISGVFESSIFARWLKMSNFHQRQECWSNNLKQSGPQF